MSITLQFKKKGKGKCRTSCLKSREKVPLTVLICRIFPSSVVPFIHAMVCSICYLSPTPWGKGGMGWQGGILRDGAQTATGEEATPLWNPSRANVPLHPTHFYCCCSFCWKTWNSIYGRCETMKITLIFPSKQNIVFELG